MQSLIMKVVQFPMSLVYGVMCTFSTLQALDRNAEHKDAAARYNAQLAKVEANAEAWNEEQLRQEWKELDRLYALQDEAKRKAIAAQELMREHRRALRRSEGKAA